jgi:hypothetical protein
MPAIGMVENVSTNTIALWLTADGWVPNNDRLPLPIPRPLSKSSFVAIAGDRNGAMALSLASLSFDGTRF